MTTEHDPNTEHPNTEVIEYEPTGYEFITDAEIAAGDAFARWLELHDL